MRQPLQIRLAARLIWVRTRPPCVEAATVGSRTREPKRRSPPVPYAYAYAYTYAYAYDLAGVHAKRGDDTCRGTDACGGYRRYTPSRQR